MSSVLLRSLLGMAVASLAAPVSAAPDFAACFTLTPGVSWSTGNETTVIARAPFAGRQVLSVTTTGGGVGQASFHDATGRQLLGNVQYGIAAWGGDAAVAAMTDVFDPAPTFPASAQPGGRFVLDGKGVRTNHHEATDTQVDYEGFSDYTFVGYEDLEVEIDYQRRTFKDTCHLSASFEGERMEAWYAAGFGRIKFERYSGDSRLISDEIDSIIAE